MMQPLLDTLLVALLDVECQQRKTPVARLQRSVERVEQLLQSIGYPETSVKLKQLREAVDPAAESTPFALAGDEDPLTGRRKRRKEVPSA
jgi:hypothetical protein